MPINKWQTIYYKDFPTVFQLFIRNTNPIITYICTCYTRLLVCLSVCEWVLVWVLHLLSYSTKWLCGLLRSRADIAVAFDLLTCTAGPIHTHPCLVWQRDVNVTQSPPLSSSSFFPFSLDALAAILNIVNYSIINSQCAFTLFGPGHGPVFMQHHQPASMWKHLCRCVCVCVCHGRYVHVHVHVQSVSSLRVVHCVSNTAYVCASYVSMCVCVCVRATHSAAYVVWLHVA